MIRVISATGLTANLLRAPPGGYRWRILYFAAWVVIGNGGAGTRAANALLNFGSPSAVTLNRVGASVSSSLSTAGDTVGAILVPFETGSGVSTAFSASGVLPIGKRCEVSANDSLVASYTFVTGDTGSALMVVDEVLNE